jgi:hypothetical protein
MMEELEQQRLSLADEKLQLRQLFESTRRLPKWKRNLRILDFVQKNCPDVLQMAVDKLEAKGVFDKLTLKKHEKKTTQIVFKPCLSFNFEQLWIDNNNTSIISHPGKDNQEGCTEGCTCSGYWYIAEAEIEDDPDKVNATALTQATKEDSAIGQSLEYKYKSYEELSREFQEVCPAAARAFVLIPQMYNRLTLVDSLTHKDALAKIYNDHVHLAGFTERNIRRYLPTNNPNTPRRVRTSRPKNSNTETSENPLSDTKQEESGAKPKSKKEEDSESATLPIYVAATRQGESVAITEHKAEVGQSTTTGSGAAAESNPNEVKEHSATKVDTPKTQEEDTLTKEEHQSEAQIQSQESKKVGEDVVESEFRLDWNELSNLFVPDMDDVWFTININKNTGRIVGVK